MDLCRFEVCYSSVLDFNLCPCSIEIQDEAFRQGVLLSGAWSAYSMLRYDAPLSSFVIYTHAPALSRF